MTAVGRRSATPIAYLDHNATTPLRPDARAAMLAALDDCGNPSSTHRAGRQARRRIETARAEVAALVAADPERVVFTSGATEANALALLGHGRARVLVSATEHPSVRDTVPDAEVIPVDGRGIVDLEALARLLVASPRPALVAVQLANNETGVVQPVAEVARLARAHGALVHCDAAQGGGKLAIDMTGLGVSSLALSAHKLGGPPGVGALVLGSDHAPAPLWRGGGQERRRRAGTENWPGIAGFGAAARVVATLPDRARWTRLRARLESAIRDRDPEARVFGAAAERLANTSCLAMAGVEGETQVIAFDLEGIAVSAGAACASGKRTTSPVLTAMGVDAAWARCAIRVSLGWTTRAEDVDRFVAAWWALRERSRGMAPGRPASPWPEARADV